MKNLIDRIKLTVFTLAPSAPALAVFIMAVVMGLIMVF